MVFIVFLPNFSYLFCVKQSGIELIGKIFDIYLVTAMTSRIFLILHPR